MSRRDRLEARAERRREWAASRDSKVAAVNREAEKYRGDVAFNTQPGHIPARARLNERQDRAAGDYQMARHHESAAAGIERQLETSIFSDDDNAVEALEAKALAIDAAADRCKSVNAAYRKAPGVDQAAKLVELVVVGTITEVEARHIARTFAIQPWVKQPFPAYHLTNLRANARRCRERIKAIKAQAEQSSKAEADGGTLVELVGEAKDYARVTFTDYPGRDVVQALKSAGFHWSRPSWYGTAANLPDRVRAMSHTLRENGGAS